MSPLFGFLPNLGPWELMVILVLGVLLFGRKLPDVGRYVGKGIVEFKKGIKGIEDDVEGSNPVKPEVSVPAEPSRPPQKITASAPKFGVEDAPKNVASTPPQI